MIQESTKSNLLLWQKGATTGLALVVASTMLPFWHKRSLCAFDFIECSLSHWYEKASPCLIGVGVVFRFPMSFGVQSARHNNAMHLKRNFYSTAVRLPTIVTALLGNLNLWGANEFFSGNLSLKTAIMVHQVQVLLFLNGLSWKTIFSRHFPS